MGTLERFNEIKKKHDDLKQKADKAAGSVETLLARLKKEYDCDNLSEGTEMLASLEKDEKKADREFNEQFELVEKKFGSLLVEK